MNPGDILVCFAIFVGLVLGLGLPLVAGLSLQPDEKLCAAVATALFAIYLAAVGIYLLVLPRIAFAALPLAAFVLLFVRWRACLADLRDPAVRRMLGAWLIVAGWTLGFLALVRNYSGLGSGVVGDWAEHYQRTQFFLLHEPLSTKFIWIYTLTARPPLANLVTGAFLALTRLDFAHFQVFSSLESSLVFLPALLFVRRFSSALRAEAVFLLIFLLNPLVLHNSTYPWTKLITAFFVLSGFYFFLRSRDGNRGHLAIGAFACLAAGFLAHYSAGPYIVALVIAWFWQQRRARPSVRFWIETGACALGGGLILATWFGWAIHTYGVAGTFLSNTSVTTSDHASLAGFLGEKAMNLFNTVVPHPFRHVFDLFILPHWPPLFIRDYAFALYQVNLLFVFGSAGGLLLCWLLWREWRLRRSPARSFWAFFIGFVVIVGISVNGGVDTWGLAHICLQPLVVLGLAFLAARLGTLSRTLRACLIAGLTVDFLFGIALHFSIEHLDLSFRLWLPDHGHGMTQVYGPTIAFNVLAKQLMQCQFIGDRAPAAFLLIAFLAILFGLALLRLRLKNSSGRNFPLPTQP